VKNNLQIISSLLNMQAMKAADESVVESLLESRSRIHTMAIIHSQLYQSENLKLVEMNYGWVIFERFVIL
jgi:two-component sensor histidine kinase